MLLWCGSSGSDGPASWLVLGGRGAGSNTHGCRRSGCGIDINGGAEKSIFCNAPMAWSLACLRRSIPIMGEPVHPRGGDGVVFFCYSVDGNLNLNVVGLNL